ncbi:methyl-coenzyme M reductase glutamine C-methyltransferase [Methanothermococcus okinawensis]|uniref:Radical SAM domain protein n=1 Tax=Methanothermococcus okinawensis (strain DSM 14208 / JCM 11175 / IH1) TaxID=647113 RepID=F8AL46_METOI|nr:methyl-coenzyme M reductase glutamine C-methyltransferase [Methanothermococcus okinawensis]AEH06484.1 Radical SAM domain protein [Methanothermococcus okinawensis IH1]
MKKITIYSPNYYTYGAMLIGGVLKEKFKNKYDVKLVKTLDNNSINLFLKSDYVLLSLYSTLHLMDKNLKKVIELLQNNNKHNSKKTKIFVGGPVSAYPEIVLNELNVDGVILGEGEIITPKIIEGDKEGLAYLENGEIIINKPKPKPKLDFSKPLIPKDIGAQSIRGANVYIETHRGCIGNCTFCQVPKFFGKDIRSKPLELILEEVKEFKKKGVKRIAISGGTGSLYNFKKEVNKSMFIELLEKVSRIIGNKNLSVPDMRVDYVDRDTLTAVKKYTIGWVFYGIESGSDKILKSMKKGTNREKNLNAVNLAKECGVKVGGSFIVGHPEEKEVDYLLTKDFIVDAELDDVFVSIAEPIPKTELCDLILDTPIEKNPTFKTHLGPYKRLNLTESEARCFDLLLHAENWKSNPHILTKQLYSIYLNEAKTQGKDIRNITNLIFKYKKFL